MKTLSRMTDQEVALHIAQRLREWRVSPQGAAMTQADLSRKSGVGTTPIKRFEKTGAATLGSFIAMMRALGLVEHLDDLVPDPRGPSPVEIFDAQEKQRARVRAPRAVKRG